MNSLLIRICTEEIGFFHPSFLLRALEDPPAITSAEHPYMQRMRDQLKPQRTMVTGGVAILPIQGALARKPDPFEMAFFGIEDSGAVLDMINAAWRDPEVLGAVLNIDSPGGMVTGGLEVSDAVAAMNRDKPVVAWSGGLAASMGYHIASGASRIIGSRSAQFGSIGTIISYLDVTARLKAAGIEPVTFVSKDADLKATTMPGVPMTDARRAYLQARVDSAGTEFQDTVASRRGPLNDEVKRGGMFFSEQAVKLGLIDGIGPLEWAISNVRSLIRAR